jgi:hypothetical protein
MGPPNVKTIPHCQNNPTLTEQSHTVKTISHRQNNPSSVALLCQCGIVLTVWNCSDSVVLF